MRNLISLIVFLSIVNLAWSQGKITGVIRDQNGEIIPFATITDQATKTSTSADAAANFTIAAKAGDVLRVSAVGIQDTTVVVGTESVLNITVRRVSGAITDVVVTTARCAKTSQRARICNNYN